MGKHKKKVHCSKCGTKGVKISTHCFSCRNHHKTNEPCFTSLSQQFKLKEDQNLEKSALSSKRVSNLPLPKSNQYSTKCLKASSNYLLPSSSQSNQLIEFYHDQWSGLFLPVPSSNQNPQLLLHQHARKSSCNSEDWLKHTANANNMLLFNPHPDGDCLFHIIT